MAGKSSGWKGAAGCTSTFRGKELGTLALAEMGLACSSHQGFGNSNTLIKYGVHVQCHGVVGKTGTITPTRTHYRCLRHNASSFDYAYKSPTISRIQMHNTPSFSPSLQQNGKAQSSQANQGSSKRKGNGRSTTSARSAGRSRGRGRATGSSTGGAGVGVSGAVGVGRRGGGCSRVSGTG
jgi:hypothetical protein